MNPEILLYTPIYDEAAQLIINSLQEFSAAPVCDLRVCSPGGGVYFGWGICAKMIEVGNVNLKIDGIAASMAGFLPLFAKTSEALDVADIMIHRADMYVYNDEDQAQLDKVNTDLYKRMKARIDDKILKELKGVTLKDIFESETRISVWLTAAEAKKIGLINKVVKLAPQEISAIQNNYLRIAATAATAPSPVNPSPNPNPINPITMTKDEFKAKFPDVYNAISAEGVAQENDRIAAWMMFNEIDPAAVAAGIKSNKVMTSAQMAELTLKSVNSTIKAALAATSPAAVAAEESTEPKPVEVQKVEAFKDELYKKLGVKNPAAKVPAAAAATPVAAAPAPTAAAV